MDLVPKHAWDKIVLYLPSSHACHHYAAILDSYYNTDDLDAYQEGMASLALRCPLRGEMSCRGWNALLRTSKFAVARMRGSPWADSAAGANNLNACANAARAAHGKGCLRGHKQ